MVEGHGHDNNHQDRVMMVMVFVVFTTYINPPKVRWIMLFMLIHQRVWWIGRPGYGHFDYLQRDFVKL